MNDLIQLISQQGNSIHGHITRLTQVSLQLSDGMMDLLEKPLYSRNATPSEIGFRQRTECPYQIQSLVNRVKTNLGRGCSYCDALKLFLSGHKSSHETDLETVQ